MDQTVKSVIPGVIAGLINWAFILPAISIGAAFYPSLSFEAKLSFVNTALILVTILLILRREFSRQRVRVIKTQIAPHTYLVQKNVARHIPDTETFEYLGKIYGFHQGNIETIAHDDFGKLFSTESTLPSILPFCQAFYLQKVKQQKLMGDFKG